MAGSRAEAALDTDCWCASGRDSDCSRGRHVARVSRAAAPEVGEKGTPAAGGSGAGGRRWMAPSCQVA